MATNAEYQHPDGRYESVKGFYWTAFIFPHFWCFFNGQVALGFVLLPTVIIANIASRAFPIFLIPTFAFAIWFGFHAADLKRNKLLASGFLPGGSASSDIIFDVITRQCPRCNKVIKRVAEQCPYCKNSFDPEYIAFQISQQRQIVSAQLKETKDRGSRKCPACGEYTVDMAVIEGGAWGDWCAHCKMSLQQMKAQGVDIDSVNSLEATISDLEIDEEIEKLETRYLELCEQGLCPTCGKFGVYKATIEDGGSGDWCPHCKMSLQKMSSLTVEK